MTNHSMTASLLVNLDGNLQQQAARYENNLQNFSRNGTRHLTGLQRATASLDRGLTSLGNRWIALASGGSVVAAGKQVLDFDAKLTRMQTSAQMTDDQLAVLKTRLQDVANQQDVRVPIDDLTAAVDEFLGKTGDIGYAMSHLENIGYMMQGLGIEASSAGLLLAQFWEDGIRDPKDVIATLDKLFAQFALGTVDVKDIARVSAELFSTIRTKGPEAISDIGALAQIYAKTAGNAGKAQTSLKATVKALNDAKAKKIDALLARNGLAPIRDATGMIRRLPQLLLDIAKAAKDSEPKLNELFDGEAMDGLKSLIDPANKALLVEMTKELEEYGLTLAASEKNAATAAAAMVSIFNAGRKLADLTLSGPIKELADTINDLDDSRLVELMETAKDVALALGGLVIGHKVLKVGSSIRGAVKGAAGDTLSGAAAMSSAPIPVFVVNQIPGGMAGSVDVPDTQNGKSAAGKKPGMLLRAANFAGGVTAAAGALSMGYSIGTVINETFIKGTAMGDAIGKNIAAVLAAFGNDEARAAMVASGDVNGSRWDRSHYKTPADLERERKDAELTDQKIQKIMVELGLTPEVSKMLKVTHTKNKSDVDLEVSGSFGPSMRSY